MSAIVALRRLAARTTTTSSSMTRGLRTSAPARGNPGDPGICRASLVSNSKSFLPRRRRSLSVFSLFRRSRLTLSLSQKNRIHPRERNVLDQGHLLAEIDIRDGSRGRRRGWCFYSHFCGELSTEQSWIKNLYIKNINNNTRRERERNWIVVGNGARRKMREELFFVTM